MPTPNILDKEQVFNYALLFTVTRSAIAKATGNAVTNKTDRIILNSLLKAVDKHAAQSKEEI